MDITKLLVEHASKHFWKPMIHPGKESVQRRDSHHQMKVCNHKIGVMHVDIQGAISQNDSRQTSL